MTAESREQVKNDRDIAGNTDGVRGEKCPTPTSDL
jgi:hypothetical protein